MRDNKARLLQNWAQLLTDAARSGGLTGKPCAVTRAETICGPRAGALEIAAGLDAGRLLQAMRKNDCALARQFVPWNFVGNPQAFMAGRYVRVEAGWPSDMAENMIRLADLNQRPYNGGRWAAGKSEGGATIIPALCDRTPHFLFAGQTGSGKSVALRCAILQLSADPDNEIILVDGKAGESLKAVERLPGVLGPVATDGPQARAALGWACAQMKNRYEAEYYDKRLVVVFDEFQEMAGDAVVSDLLRKLAAQGRAAGVHLLAATQHPTVEAFGDASTRRNLTGKAALRVGDPDASRVAVGGATPRADHLLGAGDCYLVTPGSCHRIQGAYVDEQEITAAENGGHAHRFTRWPEYEPESIGRELPNTGWKYSGQELAVSIVSATHGEGRPRMVSRLMDAQLGRPGAERAIRLLGLGRDVNDWFMNNGFAVCLAADTTSPTDMIQIVPDVW